jgi:glutamyl-tRNA reductase
MSVLVVGLSHKSAPIATLERAAVGSDTLGKLLSDIVRLPDIAEAFVISTCNRVEVYADVDRFHGGVAGICELLSRHSGIPSAELTASLYVHYEDRAVQHLLSVASGLDSVVVGEDQIIGQVRAAVRVAEEHGTMGRVLRDLGRVALHAGKRARAETGIDRLGLSLVGVGIGLALPELAAVPPGAGGVGPSSGPGGERGAEPPYAGGLAGGSSPREQQGLAGRSVLVVGAGTMSGLAVAAAARLGADRVVVANRTVARARRLAASVHGEVADVADLAGAMARADLVISCTGAAGLVITEAVVRDALSRRAPAAPLVLLDLAMPRDVDPAAATLPGVHLIGMDRLSSEHAGVGAAELTAVRSIVDDEFAAYGSAVRAAQVTPTVVALRAKAATVVDAELARLTGRLSEESLSGHALEEIARTVRRVVDKLLHAPTVRVKELASAPGGEDYEVALRVLFDLDPRAVEAVTRAESDPLNSADQEGEQ